jgi:aminoglycoside phosphotransferase (APT) family kinase protein
VTYDEDDTAREALLQDHASSQCLPVPGVVAWGSSRSVLGRPFVLTPWSEGTAFAMRSIRRVPEQLAETMTALHDLPADDIAGKLAGCGWTRQRMSSLGVLDDVDRYATELNDPDLTNATTWLRTHAPSFGACVVCHGDLHPLNLLYDRDRVTAILDWELARLADPAFDVARTAMLLRMAPYPMAKIARRLLAPLAERLASAFVDAYRARRSLDDTSLLWHDVLHCVRTLTMAMYGAAHPGLPRLRRLADVWLPVAPQLRKRLAACIQPRVHVSEPES